MNRETLRRMLLAGLCACSLSVGAADAFRVSDIRVEGLRRISPGTVFNHLPIQVGETTDDTRIAEAVRALFRSGLFDDVSIRHEGDVLVVDVRERPTIADIRIDGNEAIETEPLTDGLKQAGVAEGQVFDRSLLDRVEQELRRQYFAEGYYAVRLTSEITPLEENRVGVRIDIVEGPAARIRELAIVGNTRFGDEELLEHFKLGPTSFWSFYTRNDQYSKQTLAGDIETLRAWYLDRGYINFRIDSTQVTIGQDRRDIHIAINITEGDQYLVDEVRLAGDIPVDPQALVPLVTLAPGEVFSRKATTETTDRLSDHLGQHGYAFANINTVPDVDEKNHKVKVTFFIDPGRRAMVRRINMAGNTRTRDEVLRREMRQMESAWLSTKQVERSRARLQKLGYFEKVNVETPPVPGTADQVDVNVNVTERALGNIMAGVGFSQAQGIVLSGSVSQDNFLGSGKRVSVAANTSNVTTLYRFSFTNPYHTIDGISRGFRLAFRETDAEEADLTDYATDEISAGLDYGMPLNEYDRLGGEIEISNTSIKTGDTPSQEVLDFIDDEGDEFNLLKTGASWSHDTRNRAYFPSRGVLQRLSGEIAVPGSELNFYKVEYSHKLFVPLTRRHTLLLGGRLGYGDAYGGGSDLPLFENYFAGGVRSVRGYDEASLGPIASDGDPLGGNFLTVANVEFIFPAPFQREDEDPTVQTSVFFDAGNVFGPDYDFDVGELRTSTGVGLDWLSPLGPLNFVLAWPINPSDDDDTQYFQFSLGQTF